jgi:hypothetical protein
VSGQEGELMFYLKKLISAAFLGIQNTRFNHERKIIINTGVLLKKLYQKAEQCLKRGGKILLFTFSISLSREKTPEFEEALIKKFRIYDLVAKLSPNLYTIGVIFPESSEEDKSINICQIIARIKEATKESGINEGELNYVLKVIPHDGTNIKLLLKESLKELQQEDIEHNFSAKLSET